MRAIVCGDPHLSSGAWTDRPEIDGDAYFAFQQVVDIAVEQQLPLFLLGDVFDRRRPDPRSVECFCRQMDRMQAAALPVLVVQGQHELDRASPWLLVHTHPKHLHKQAVQVGDQLVVGLDWLPRGELQAALDELPAAATVLLCHQVWSDVMGVGKTDGAFCDIPHVRWVLTGDYHETYVRQACGKSGQEMTVMSTGSTHMRSISEPVEKQVLLLDTACTHPTPILLRTRACYEFTVSTTAELDQLCTLLRNGITIGGHSDARLPPLVRTTFYDDVPEVYGRVTAAAAGSCNLFWKRIPRQMEMEISVQDLPATTTASLTASLSVATINPRVQERASRLLASVEPDTEQREQYAEYQQAAKA